MMTFILDVIARRAPWVVSPAIFGASHEQERTKSLSPETSREALPDTPDCIKRERKVETGEAERM